MRKSDEPVDSTSKTIEIGINLLGFTTERIQQIAAGPIKAYQNQHQKLSMKEPFREEVSRLLTIDAWSSLNKLKVHTDAEYFVSIILKEMNKLEGDPQLQGLKGVDAVKKKLALVGTALNDRSVEAKADDTKFNKVVAELDVLEKETAAVIATFMRKDLNVSSKKEQIAQNMAQGVLLRDSQRSSLLRNETETVSLEYNRILARADGIVPVKEKDAGKSQIIRANVTKVQSLVEFISDEKKMAELAAQIGYPKIIQDLESSLNKFTHNISESIKVVKPYDTGSSEDLGWVRDSRVLITQLKEKIGKLEALAQPAAVSTPIKEMNSSAVSVEKRASSLPSWTNHSTLRAVQSDDPSVKIAQINALRLASVANVVKSDSVGSIVITGADFNKVKEAAEMNNMRIQEVDEKRVILSDDTKNTHVEISVNGDNVSFSAKAPSGAKKEEAVDQMISLAVEMTEKYQVENIAVTKDTPQGDMQHQIMEKFDDKASRDTETYKI